jgi:hypothetical protein
MHYDRPAAMKYADTYWNIPCDDGVFWVTDAEVRISQVRTHNILHNPDWKAAPKTDGWEPIFVYDGDGGEKAVFRKAGGDPKDDILIQPWEGLADCAHYLSNCLSAGGLKVSEISVPKLVKHLKDRSDTKTLCEQAPVEAGQRIIDAGMLKPGDMIGYFNIDPKGDYNGARQYAHSTMYVGKINGKTDGGITCHTKCRYPGRSWTEDSWWLEKGSWLYTFIHFTGDDSAPNAAKVSTLSGLWKHTYGGSTFYYFVNKDGTAAYSRTAPKKGQVGIPVAEGKAYWFMDPSGVVTFTWNKTGSIEVWTQNGAGYTSLVNASLPGKVERL